MEQTKAGLLNIPNGTSTSEERDSLYFTNYYQSNSYNPRSVCSTYHENFKWYQHIRRRRYIVPHKLLPNKTFKAIYEAMKEGGPRNSGR